MQTTINEIPEVITAGKSREEAKELLADALHSYVLALGDLEGSQRHHTVGRRAAAAHGQHLR